jgi:lipopolysaccharide export system protein LptC
LTHNPQDDSYDITQPIVRNLSNPESPVIMKAERARVSSDNSEVHLYDNVRLDRPGSATNQPMHMRSEYLLVLPDDDVMKTDKPVEITACLRTMQRANSRCRAMFMARIKPRYAESV